MNFRKQIFKKFNFTHDQVLRNYKNALKDLDIAKRDDILEVKFNYTYTALIKAGITLLSLHKIKIRSLPGHHVAIIDSLSDYLKDDSVADIGHLMRSKRNLDLYEGGIEVTRKECKEFIDFADMVLSKVKELIT